MKYMHSKSFLHRDIKPENILIDEYLFPKISDFGLSKFLSNKVREINSSIFGTPSYIAPEIWSDNDYSKASDVYAFALVVFEIMTNEKALSEFNFTPKIVLEVGDKGYRPKFKVPIPPCYKKLIEDCWSQDPKKRPSFEQIIYIMKTNPEFITENVDRDTFLNYTSYINEYYYTSKLKKSVSTSLLKTYVISNSKEKINQNSIILFTQVIETEMKTNYYLDLKNYEQKELIRKGEYSKVFKVIQKDSNKSYSAKLSDIDITQFKEEEMMNIAREYNQISKLNHGSILKFIGFSPYSFKNEPKPIVITELTSNKTLNDILHIERSNVKIPNWNPTKKLINIYGIASAMKYLHSFNIIHRNLKPNSIIMDDNLYPKLSDFGLCSNLLLMNSMTFKTSSKLISPPVYSAPEILISAEHTKASDVYSFAMIVYEIITKEKPTTNSNNSFSGFLLNMSMKNKRPEFKNSIDICYQNMIEACWAENPEERPSFEQIVDLLENDPAFITSDINKEEYFDYIKMISSI